MSRNTLITGASSGLGAEMARQFAARGYDLALCARRLDRLESLRDSILAQHPERRIAVRPLDVTDDQQVFDVFRDFAQTFDTINRVVVNAGVGKGVRIGTGGYRANKETAVTNFLGALAQIEAAMEIFRRQNHGHLVMVASISALRGMPKAITAYGASKAGAAALAEGVRADVVGTPIKVTVVYPGYIRSEMNDGNTSARFMASTEDGVRAIVDAVEKEKPRAYVPAWPWLPIGVALKNLPLPVARRMIG